MLKLLKHLDSLITAGRPQATAIWGDEIRTLLARIEKGGE
jgi:hypothetical protein